MSEAPDAVVAGLADRYGIGRKLGEGATSVVYAARDFKHDREVAVKVLRPELALATDAARFAREIRIAASLSHPHIVPLFDSGEVGGVPYFVMPLMTGETLRMRLRRDGPLPVDVAVSIARQVASALEYAHAQGVVHRDIKPENILIVGGEVQVADFGVAYALDVSGSIRITASGLAIGTPLYMSPEQAQGDPALDGRSDIYALGCVLHEMLTGSPPFDGGSVRSIFGRHAMESPPSVRASRADVSPGVDAAIRQALAKSPGRRFSSANAFAAALTTGAAMPAWRSTRRRTVVLAAAALVAVLTGVWITTHRTTLPRSGRSWILIADFAAPDSDRALAVAVRELVAAGLAQSRLMSLVPQEQLQIARRNAKMADTAVLEVARARELAVRSSVRIVVAGSVSRLGRGAYSFALHALNADDGRDVVSEAVTATDEKGALIGAVEQLVRRLRGQLGERPEEIAATRPLENVSTPSFAAFLLYQDGLQLMRNANLEGSRGMLRQAIAHDSGFASALALLAHTYVNARQPDSARAIFTQALRFADRLSDADRDRLRGDVAFHVDHDAEAAIRYYDRYLEQRPASLAGHNNRAGFLSAMGRHAEALKEVRLAMSIDPLQVGPRKIEMLNEACELLSLGRIDSARIAARKLDGPQAQFTELILLSAESRWDSLARYAQRLADDPLTGRFVRFPATTSAAAALAALGDTAAATARLEKAIAASHSADLRWFVQARILYDAARKAKPAWTMPAELRSDPGVEAEFVRGEYAALTGDAPGVARALATLEHTDSIVRRRIGFGTELLRLQLAMTKGDAAASAIALAPLASLARVGENDPYSPDRASTFALRWTAAAAMHGAGNDSGAVSTLRLLSEPGGYSPLQYPARGFVVPAAERLAGGWTSGRATKPGAKRSAP